MEEEEELPAAQAAGALTQLEAHRQIPLTEVAVAFSRLVGRHPPLPLIQSQVPIANIARLEVEVLEIATEVEEEEEEVVTDFIKMMPLL